MVFYHLTLQRDKIINSSKYLNICNIDLDSHVNVVARVRIDSIKASIQVPWEVRFLDVNVKIHWVPYKAWYKSLLLFENTAGGEERGTPDIVDSTELSKLIVWCLTPSIQQLGRERKLITWGYRLYAGWRRWLVQKLMLRWWNFVFLARLFPKYTSRFMSFR